MTPNAPNPRAILARWWPLAAAVLIAVVTWPAGSVTPTWGVDPSWRIALHMAVAQGVDFGDIAFTYGPLGFLNVPLNAEAHTFVPSVLWVLLLQTGLAYLMIELVRRSFGWPVAVILALVTCRLLDDSREVLPLIAFLWAALVIQWGVPGRVGRWLLPVSGVLAGMGLLIKFNEGVVALVLAGVAAWWLGPGRWRAVGVFAGAALAGVVVPWVAMGNGLAGLPDWLRASARIAAGYSSGLPYEDITRSWEYPLFIGAVGVIAWFAWQEGDAPSRARRVAILLLGVFFVFTVFKHAFVRHDLGHTPSSFTALIVVAAAVRWRDVGRTGRLAASAACGAALVATLVAQGVTSVDAAGRFLDPRPRLERMGDVAALVVDPGERRAERERAKAAIREHHYIPLEVIAALKGHGDHVEPHDTSIVWAYDLDWDPPPVFQDYTIVTNALDRANAAALRGPDRPERILRHAGNRIDSHSPEGEGPEQLLAMICDYRPEVAVPGWLVLQPAPSRCGPERPIATVTARAGERIPIPPAPTARDMVLARLDIPVPPLERLRTALYKPRRLPEVYHGPELRYRVPVDVARGPLLMRVPPDIGWPEYAQGLPYRTVTVNHVASPFRIHFVAVRVDPPAPEG